jgi:hypothetical protein
MVLAGALFVALRPFDLHVDIGGRIPVSGTCDAAASTAWQDGWHDQLALWSVTVGTNMMGYMPVFGKSAKYVLLDGEESAFPGPYCVGEARHRLIVSGTIAAAGFTILSVGLLLAHRRMRAVS